MNETGTKASAALGGRASSAGPAERSNGETATARITTEHVYPPIPVRDFDWCAYEGDYDLGATVGWGRTEADAIADLKELLEDRT